MKNIYPGYYTSTKEEFEKIWNSCLFVFDTNILLNQYRYSENTKNMFFDILKNYHDRLWIPMRVAEEYHRNIYVVVKEQLAKYDYALKEFAKTVKIFTDKSQHPFLGDEVQSKLSALQEEIDSILNTKLGELRKLEWVEEIKEKLAYFLENKVGNGFTEDQLQEIYVEGESRFQRSIPPGYKDRSKPANEKFGDLIIWKEIISKAQEAETRPIVFITDDNKEDFFFRVSGLTIGPNPLLINEFKKLCPNHDILIYRFEQFLNYANDHLELNIEPKIFDKIIIEAAEVATLQSSKIEDTEAFIEDTPLNRLQSEAELEDEV